MFTRTACGLSGYGLYGNLGFLAAVQTVARDVGRGALMVSQRAKVRAEGTMLRGVLPAVCVRR